MALTETAEVQVPTFISGIILPITLPDFCMDGAKYEIRSHLGLTRLKAKSKDVDGQLKKASGRRIRMTVAGYLVFGPECRYLSVYYAAPSTDLQLQLAVKDWQ